MMNFQMMYDAQKNMKLTPLLKERYDALIAMDHLVMCMNDEDAYMSWINLVPDEATEYDLADIACCEDDFDETVELFKRLWKNYAAEDGGLFIAKKTY